MSDKPERDDKTEAPTDKRRREAAEKGDVLKSRDLTTGMVMMAGSAYVAVAGAWLVQSMANVMRMGLGGIQQGRVDFEPGRALWNLGQQVAMPLAGLFAVCIVAAIASQALLGSFSFNGALMAPKASRMNPASYARRVFGAQGLTELGKSILKVVLVGAVGGGMLWSYAHDIAQLGAEDIHGAIVHTGHLTIGLLLLFSFALMIVAGIDVPLQLWQLLGRLRMSKQELKDELKQTEGSPEVKMALRRRQREAVRNNVRAAMSTAHVVLTNPTHFAVALRYDKLKDRAPVVVAKGKDLVAEVIRELAGDNEVPIMEYPVLARAVFFTSRIGQEIRDDLYVAVASVLAFVFSVERDRLLKPMIDVPEGARFDEFGKPL
jgi:flagellar biosynthesis protein FlhB